MCQRHTRSRHSLTSTLGAYNQAGGDSLTLRNRIAKIAVVVVDDHPLFLAGLQQLFKKQSDFELVGVAEDVAQLQAVLARTQPAVILMDIEMPQLDGIEALALVRKQAPGTKVVMLTGYDQPELIVRALKAGAVGYLRQDVAEAINAYLVARETVKTDKDGTPLFTAVGNFAGGGRLSRRGIRKTVDSYVARAELKRPGVSGHALRHTAATLAYKHTRDLRGVQEMLGHSDPKVTTRYAHVVDRAQNNPAAAVPVSV
jgi:DNA-binding NarL/FixJ family response regulator